MTGTLSTVRAAQTYSRSESWVLPDVAVDCPAQRPKPHANRTRLQPLTQRYDSKGRSRPLTYVRFPSPAPFSGNTRQPRATKPGPSPCQFGNFSRSSSALARKALPHIALSCPSNRTQRRTQHLLTNPCAIHAAETAGHRSSPGPLLTRNARSWAPASGGLIRISASVAFAGRSGQGTMDLAVSRDDGALC
jgi:hypothetical protein